MVDNRYEELVRKRDTLYEDRSQLKKDFKDIQTIRERTGKGRGGKRDSVLEI